MFESLEMLAISSSKSRGVYLEPNLGILLVKERFGMTRGDSALVKQFSLHQG